MHPNLQGDVEEGRASLAASRDEAAVLRKQGTAHSEAAQSAQGAAARAVTELTQSQHRLQEVRSSLSHGSRALSTLLGSIDWGSDYIHPCGSNLECFFQWQGIEAQFSRKFPQHLMTPNL